jgi:flagellar M-ring protein FliF
LAGEQNFGQVMGQIGEFARGLSAKQRVLLAGGALAVAAVLFVFVRLIGAPEYKTLYTGLTPADAQAMSARLAAKNIEAKLSPDGASISVPADKLDASRLEVASQGGPKGGRMGFELFDKTNWAASDFSEQVNYQRALEAELERTIETLDGIEGARVHLVLAKDSLFADEQRESKAAVVLKLRGRSLAPETQRTIAQLVASAVDRLRPEEVTVADSEGTRPLPAPGPNGAAGAELEQQLATRIVATLEPVVGADHVRASVRVEYDPSTSEESSEEYDPTRVVALTMRKSEEKNNSAEPGGIPGTASNLPAEQSGQKAASMPQDSRTSATEDGTYAVNRVVRHTMLPAGRVKRIAAALLVDDVVEQKGTGKQASTVRRKRTPEEMKQIEELARAAIGLDMSRGDIIAVNNLSFQEKPVETPAAMPITTRVRNQVNQWSDLVRYFLLAALFAAVYLLVLRPVKRSLVESYRQMPLRPSTTLAGTASGPVLAAATEIPGLELPEGTPESKRLSALKRAVAEKVKAEPAVATQLVQGWLESDLER